MKRFKLITIMFVILVFGTITEAYAVDASIGKIGYVDLSRLFDEYYKTKDYDSVLEAKSKDFESARNTKIDAIRDAQSKLNVLAEDKKADQQKEIDKLKADLLEYDRQKKTDLTKERNEKIREILLEIEKIVSTFAQKNSYTYIFNDRVLIYGDKTMDLTEQILKILNENQPADKTKKDTK